MNNAKEIDFPRDLDIKCLRIVSPIFNNGIIALNGLYHDLSNIEDKNKFPLQNKMVNFSIPINDGINIGNAFTLSSKFGKVLSTEELEALLIFINKSNNDIELKDIKINVSTELKDNNNKLELKKFSCNTPSNKIILKGLTSISFKLKFIIDSIAKYLIDITMICQSKNYDNIYRKEISSQQPIRNSTDKYKIIDGKVELNFSKRLTFETLFPVKTTERFFNNQMKECFIEETIINQSNRTLILFDMKLSCQSKPNEFFELINGENLTNIIIEPSIELNVIFKITDPNIFLNEKYFILQINWGNLFDINPKKFIKNIENGIDVYNSNFTLNIVDTPGKNILENQSFKVIFSLNKKSKINLVIFVEIESLKDNEKSNDREIEIIDIVDKKIELTKDNPLNTFCLICKSDVLGNVTLPKIKLTVFDSSNNEQLDIYAYEKLLTFNCVTDMNLS